MSYVKHYQKVSQERREKKSRQELLGRVTKYVKSHGLSFSSDSSPEKEIQALRQYVEGLEVMRQEMLDDFGHLPGIKDAIRRIDTELGLALKEMARAKIRVLNPTK